MRTLILAGGKGTRLLPLTEYHHKVMASIHGRPFLQYLLGLYEKHDVVLSVNHLKDGIKSWCKDNKIWPEFVEEPEFMGHSGAILYAQPFLEKCKIFAVVNGDTYHNISLNSLRREFSADKDKLALKVFATNKLTNERDCCGIYMFKPGCFKYFRKGMHTDFILRCIPTKEIYLPNKWYIDIGSHEGLRFAKQSKLFKEKQS